MLRRVLVANRGEIACRIITSLNRMGIESVAVWSDPDRSAPHVAMATAAMRIGPASAAQSYLDVDAIIDAAKRSGSEAIHPGYGFLSERAEFAEAVEAAGLVFVGPTPEQLRVFGLKHLARAAAATAGVWLNAGTDPLDGVDHAVAAAEMVGYPVMLKSSGGGGGIGMAVCRDADELVAAYDRVGRLAGANFGNAAVFLEHYVSRARHIEVQIFGDGNGSVVTLGERDCSTQRRNQKVLEETPAPSLSEALRRSLAEQARGLGESVSYRSAGTVEFIVDADTEQASFLEVNARLQVEHPVTEAVHGVDLVEWMIALAGGDSTPMHRPRTAAGHAIEVRVYAEDPARDHRPSPGTLTHVEFPAEARVDTWVEAGTEITSHYDPLLAKIIVHGPDRPSAVEALQSALASTRLAGIETNVGLLRDIATSEVFRIGKVTTSSLSTIEHRPSTIEVLSPGNMTTIQDHPGRLGLWHVGVPPSGPMDDASFRLANVCVGNHPGAPGLEITVSGPMLRFDVDAIVCVTGAPVSVHVLDGDGSERALPMWQPLTIASGAVLRIGSIGGVGLRAALAVRGGFDVPIHLGSAATFTLGGFGGHAGRALRTGDVLHIAPVSIDATEPTSIPSSRRPIIGNEWKLAVLEGPHGAPDFFTPEDLDEFYATRWEVHFNSARTGVRLIGPKPAWARSDGGEAGLHPSNIHDTPYAVGAVDFTGDMPIILGPDGPSLGGFVCPATVVAAERWKLGQLRPGDRVRFVPVTTEVAATLRARSNEAKWAGGPALIAVRDSECGVLARLDPRDDAPSVTYRRGGDDYLLVEYGPMVLDLELRLRVHALSQWLEAETPPGIVDLTAGIRSLQLHLDPDQLDVTKALTMLLAAEAELPPVGELEVSSRVVHLPLSWDDPATRLAIERYMSSVRDDAPWCPWNIEFIRRVNGLDSVDDVFRTVFDASYMVLGLGDVYLGAPVATPLDPRHRLVTTKYNPARTWTPENAVGIGGAYLCIYGMEGPGGYQFVGRTIPVWNRYRTTGAWDKPWLLRPFDQIRWYPVGDQELLDLRADTVLGRFTPQIETSRFAIADHRQFLSDNSTSIASFRQRQQSAFATERAAWEAAGEFASAEAAASVPAPTPLDEMPPGAVVVDSVMSASVWKVLVEPGERVEAGQAVVVLEAMKMESIVLAPISGTVHQVAVRPGDQVPAGSPLVVLNP